MSVVDWVERAHNLNPTVQNFVAGRYQSSMQGELFEKIGPRDGRLLYQFNGATKSDIDMAVEDAYRAFKDGRWSGRSIEYRKEALTKLAALVYQHREELGLLETLDVGKPITAAVEYDVPGAAAVIRFNAECADKFYGRVYGVNATNLSYELHRPIGVVAAIVGWNFPLYLAAQKIGPALATGNTVVLKPSEWTSLSAARLAELAVQAGIPEGVFNVVHGGAAVGACLADHPKVELITFTGSTQTGKRVMAAAASSNLKRVILECGGKSPNIVFADSPDLRLVAASVVESAFRNQGEVCVASSRLLVDASVKAEFMPLLIEQVANITVGDPLHSATTFGAVVSREHQRKVNEYIECGEREGARIAYRSIRTIPKVEGFYVQPMVFDGVLSKHRIAQDEIFGPVLSVMEFRDESEAIEIANSTHYGLSAELWTKDLGRAHRVSHSINAGWVVVNATAKPEGGPSDGILAIGGHKQSGQGVEGGLQGLEEYIRRTAVQLFV